MPPACLAVGRVQKPHGLKGEAVVFPLTTDPETVFAPGRQLLPLGDDEQPMGGAVEIERSRPYQRRWLVKFRGVDDRAALDALRDRLLGAPLDELEPPAEGELYEHEFDGVAVEVDGKVVGQGRGLIGVPGGQLLTVALTGGGEVLVPFRRPIVTAVDRERLVVVLDPPPGLLDL